MIKVLVVDDDANMRESIGDNLEVAGYHVATAGCGAEAIAAVKKDFYDVIIMDYNLPDLTGIDVIKQIRAINADSQILMLTAHASLDTAVKAIQESVTDFLSKPVDFDRLKHSIARASERLRFIQNERRANEQIENLSAMKSKFMSMSSHDLSNSLMTLQVSFEMLCQTFTPTDEQKKKIQYISNGISQIARLIEDLVDWASIEQGKFRLEPVVFAPGPMVEETILGPQARAAARGIALKASVEPDLPLVNADKKRVAQVLNNLLENAVRHTPRGGAVEVLVGRAQGPAGAEVQFAVRDSGEGIAKEDLDKIFQSFYQGHGQSGGRLGLGLSISKEIVEAHKGRLRVESPGKGQGATFFFTIPAAVSSS